MIKENKFTPGTFILVPNKKKLQDLSPHAQLIWLWLCNFADEVGECFPSKTKLSKCTGLSVRSVDRAVNELTDKNWMKKTNRFQEEGGQTSNFYQLFLLD